MHLQFYFPTQCLALSTDPQAPPEGPLLWAGDGGCLEAQWVCLPTAASPLAAGDPHGVGHCRRAPGLPASNGQKVPGWGLGPPAHQQLCPLPAAFGKKLLAVLFYPSRAPAVMLPAVLGWKALQPGRLLLAFTGATRCRAWTSPGSRQHDVPSSGSSGGGGGELGGWAGRGEVGDPRQGRGRLVAHGGEGGGW